MDKLVAFTHAVRAHHGQTDKVGEPYLLHPWRVAQVKWDDNDFAVVALLHDVLEDTNYNIPGMDIAVGGANNLTPDQRAALKAVTRDRHEEYSLYISRCLRYPLAMMVKYWDIQDNLDEVRMDKLPTAEQESMTKRYEHALAVLRESPAFRIEIWGDRK